jgi:hypothetical protein
MVGIATEFNALGLRTTPSLAISEYTASEKVVFPGDSAKLQIRQMRRG